MSSEIDKQKEYVAQQRFCIDCRWCVVFNFLFNNGTKSEYSCHHPNNQELNLITGKNTFIHSCEKQRSAGNNMFCQAEGNWWESKNDV